MIKYNLYRLKKESQNALVKKLESVKLISAGEKLIDGFKHEFFFSKIPDAVDIWWIQTYRDFVSIAEFPKNQIYFGVLLISDSTTLYAISLGKSHFYLRQFCDSDFGLNLAERIANKDDLRIKSSRFHRSQKSKVITTFHKGAEINFDSGESMQFIKVKTIDKTVWGNVASFGSSVQLTLSIKPEELAGLIRRIEGELQKPPQTKFPRTELVKDSETIKHLDKTLCEAIETSAATVDVDEVAVSGVDFIFADRSNYSLFLKGSSSDRSTAGELTLKTVVNFCRERGIDLYQSLDQIMVFSASEHERGHSQAIKTYLDYVDDDRHCLIDGKWNRFNASYIEYLNHEVDSLPVTHEPRFDIPSTIDEDAFNKLRAANDGYINCDKDLEVFDERYRIEKMDLYKDEALFFVKIGKPKEMGYVIDQATNTVAFLQNNAGQIEMSGQKLAIKQVCIWLILARKTRLSKLSDINSIILQLKLSNWKKAVTDAGYSPTVRLNYVT